MKSTASISGSVESFDSTNLYYMKDMTKNPRAIVVIVHGFGEHLGKYEYIKNKLNEFGYGVYRFDNRGHGRSGGKRGYVNTFKDFVKDADVFIEFVKGENPGIPIFMLGHSMGGFITASYGIMFKNRIDGQILSSAGTMEPIQVRGVRGKFYKLINRIVPKLYIKNPLIRDIPRDKEAIDIYERQDLDLRSLTLNFGVQFLIYGIGWLRQNYSDYYYPCLILHGSDDKIMEKEASIQFHSSISSTDKQIKIYDGLRHEMLKCKDRDMVLNDIGKWIEQRI
jgi:alpha-beta hydrolase superfamily lysophospholipase